MAKRKPETSESELEVLKDLWEGGPSTIREVHVRLARRKKSWAYTTVQTLMQRLEAKGYLASRKVGIARCYTASVSQDELIKTRLRDIAERVCDGSPAPLLLSLVEDNAFSAEEIESFRELLDRIAPNDEGTRPKRKKR